MIKNILKITRFTLLFLLIIILYTACGGEKVKSQWMNSPITVNGISDDWSNYKQFLYEDWNIIYSIINNDSSLSLMIQFRDKQLARRINMRGLTLWINSNGEEEKIVGIRYENRKLMDKILDDMADGNGMSQEKPNENMKIPGNNKVVEFNGEFSLVNGESNIISDNEQNGVYAAVQENQGNYCLEYTIFPTDENELMISPDTDFKLGIEISAVSDEFIELMRKRMPNGKIGDIQPPDGGMPRGGGMPGEGMRGGGRRGGGMGEPRGGNRENMRENMDAQEIWFSVTLAK